MKIGMKKDRLFRRSRHKRQYEEEFLETDGGLEPAEDEDQDLIFEEDIETIPEKASSVRPAVKDRTEEEMLPEEFPGGEEPGEPETYYEEEEPEESETYYEEEEPGESEAYYEEEPGEPEAYYEEEEPGEPEAYYEEEEPGEVETYYDGEETGEIEAYYDEEEQSEAYDEEEYAYAEPEYEPEKRVHRGPSAMEFVAILTAAAILIVGVTAGLLYQRIKSRTDALASFDEIGTTFMNLTLTGGEGIARVARAAEERALQEASLSEELPSEEAEAEGENEEIVLKQEDVPVRLTMRTIQKDLKFKFTNRDTGKLIASVPFIAEVTGPDGSKYTYTDDDMDGVIYKTGLAAGKYRITVRRPDGEKYETYLVDATEQTIEVKDQIEYKKVDVADEVKTEKEVNVAKEDTQVKPEVESVPADTVEWVESTKTVIGEGEVTYIRIDKSAIADPATGAALRILENPVQRLSSEGTSYIIDENGEMIEVNTEEEQEDESSEKEDDSDREAEEEKKEKEKEKEKESDTDEEEESEEEDTDDSEDEEESDEDEQEEKSEKEKNKKKEEEEEEEKEEKKEKEESGDGEKKTETDADAKLKDKEGRQVFILGDDGEYYKARVRDYADHDVFYIRTKETEYAYTGWQTIDGKTYYYDKNGKRVTGQQKIQGVDYNFGEDGALVVDRTISRGIDVSRWNGSIDWNAVKNSGVEFVIIRCGYRGSSAGALIEDSTYRTNIAGAKKAGLKVGVYFFTQAVNEVEAVEEASMVLGLIAGKGLDLPVYLDVEPSKGRGDAIDVATRTAVCRAFCGTIRSAGYATGIYASKNWLEEKIDAPSLAANCQIWVARYAAEMDYSRTSINMWQHTSRGQVSGISGYTDLNIRYQ